MNDVAIVTVAAVLNIIIITAAGLWYFAQTRVEMVILEKRMNDKLADLEKKNEQLRFLYNEVAAKVLHNDHQYSAWLLPAYVKKTKRTLN